jgi:carbon-monoxide dehydrogenase medium subunit
MIAPFDYRRAGSADEAIQLLCDYGDDAKLLAGGHSLLPLMKLRLAQPAVLVDIGRLADLSYIRADGDQIAIGALTRHHDIEHSDLLADAIPLLPAAAAEIGDPQIRHRGTIGGSLAHGDPASDLAAVVLALGGSMVIQGPDGQRTVAATDFFTGYMETALAANELLTEIRVPRTGGAGWSFQKFNRRAHDWAIVGVAAVASVAAAGGSNGSATGARVALVSMGPTPTRSPGVEEALAAGASVADAAEHAADGLSPRADINASGDFRRHLATVLVRRALEEAGV